MTEILTGKLNGEFSRKTFLKGGALVVGFSLAGAATVGKASAASPLGPVPGGVDTAQLDSWLSVHPDNTVTLKTGMGNISGQSTGLHQVLAEELDVGMDQIRMVRIDTWQSINVGAMNSAFSASSRNNVRAAAVAARQALVGLAATRLGAPASSLTISRGVIRSAAGSSATFGELLGDKLFNVTLQTSTVNGLATYYNTPTPLPALAPGQAPAKPIADYKIVGTRVPRVDIPGKITGAFTYVQNVRVPGMLHGRVVRPRGQSRYGSGVPIVSVDESSIKHIPNVQIVRVNDFLGVVADKEEHAIEAASQLKVVWKTPDTAALPSSGNLYASLRAAGQVGVPTQTGSVDAALAGAAKTVSGTYAWPVQMHGTLGPPAGVVSVTANGVVAFTCSQEVFAVERLLSNLLGVDRAKVRVYEHEGAGCYGGNVNVEPTVAAAFMSRAVGKPVRVQLMRWDDHGWDNYGNIRLSDIRAGIDAKGKIVAADITVWTNNSPMGSLGNVEKPGFYTSSELAGMRLPLLANVVAGSGGNFAASGAGGTYVIPNMRARGTAVQIFRSGWFRGPGAVQSLFATEQIIDDLAYAVNMDPIAFRKLNYDMANVTSQRLVTLIDAIAEMTKWQPRVSASTLGKGDVVTGRGIAVGGFAGTHVVNVADVEVNKKTGKIKVTAIYGVGDAGHVTNPESVENQFIGSMVQHLSRGMVEELKFGTKNVTSTDWVSYPIMRFKDVPSIVVAKVIPRKDLPETGAGEPGGTTVPAAVGNAFFDATGIRLRSAPMTPARVRAVLAAGGEAPAGYGAKA